MCESKSPSIEMVDDETGFTDFEFGRFYRWTARSLFRETKNTILRYATATLSKNRPSRRLKNT